jgi:hypothetical protein
VPFEDRNAVLQGADRRQQRERAIRFDPRVRPLPVSALGHQHVIAEDRAERLRGEIPLGNPRLGDPPDLDVQCPRFLAVSTRVADGRHIGDQVSAHTSMVRRAAQAGIGENCAGSAAGQARAA